MVSEWIVKESDMIRYESPNWKKLPRISLKFANFVSKTYEEKTKLLSNLLQRSQPEHLFVLLFVLENDPFCCIFVSDTLFHKTWVRHGISDVIKASNTQ